jgi:hypothetical protein
MDYFNTEKRLAIKKEKQYQLFVTPIITVFPGENKLASNLLPIYIPFHELFLALGGLGCVVSCLAAVGIGGVVGGAVVLPALGFTAGGITAGSWAASLMSCYGGAVPAGSVCACLQSAGAVGVPLAALRTPYEICKALCNAYSPKKDCPHSH